MLEPTGDKQGDRVRAVLFSMTNGPVEKKKEKKAFSKKRESTRS